MMSAVPDHIKDNVRAVLLSKTDGSGVLVSQFLRDYKTILHQPLLYRDLGYQTLQDLIKAIPDCCRLEFSDKDMAYRLYGITKPNTFISSFVKRAEGSQDTTTNPKDRQGRRPVNSHERNGLGTSLDEEWEPNMRGHYTVCFQNKQGNGLETRERVALQFAKVGEVADINIIKSMTFIRYNDQIAAKTALRIWGETIGLRRADEKIKNPPKKESPRDNNRNKASNTTIDTRNDTHSLADERSPPGRYRQIQDSSSTENKSDREEKENKTQSDGLDIQVYIGNWPNQANLNDLKEVLQGFNCHSYKIHQGKQCSMKKYAFVDFKSMKDAKNFIDVMNGQKFMSRDLIVRLAERSVEKPSSSVNEGESRVSPKVGGNIEEEFERLFVHRGQEEKVSPKSRTFTNEQARKPRSGGYRSDSSSSPMKMPPLESCMPDLDDGMPDLEPISSPSRIEERNSNSRELTLSHKTSIPDSRRSFTSPKMPNLVLNFENKNFRDDTEEMPDLECMSTASGSLSHNSSDPVQLFITNFPYGTKEWELLKMVDPYGGHSLVMMNKDMTNRSTYAFVTFDDLQQAQMAILNLDQSLFKHRRLTVAMASTELSGILSPDTSFSNNHLAKITCTVGALMAEGQKSLCDDNNERMVSVEGKSGSRGHKSQISPIAKKMTSGGDRSFFSAREESFNYRLFTVRLKDYSQMVTKLRGDDDIQFYARQKLRILVTHVECERFFWGQVLIDNETGVYSNLEALQKIMTILQTDERTKHVHGLGRCQAQFEGEWYRAWCTHVMEKNGQMYGDIFYLDYGNRALLPLSEVFCSSRTIWTIPPLAKPFKMQEVMCQTESLQNKVIVVEILEAGTAMTNYMSTVIFDGQ